MIVGVALGVGVFVGRRVALGAGVFVGRGVALGAGVFVGRGVALGAGVFVGRRVAVGAAVGATTATLVGAAVGMAGEGDGWAWTVAWMPAAMPAWLVAWASSRAATCASTVASKSTSGALSPHATSAVAMSAATPTIIRNMSLPLLLPSNDGKYLIILSRRGISGQSSVSFPLAGAVYSYGGAGRMRGGGRFPPSRE